MLILTSIRSEVATDEELKDTSFKNEENNEETNELEIKTEDITVNDHDENEIDIKINNIVDGADVNNLTGSEPAALPITSTKCSQDIQVLEYDIIFDYYSFILILEGSKASFFVVEKIYILHNINNNRT